MDGDEDATLSTVIRTDHATHTLTAIHKLYLCHQLCDMTLLVADNVTFSVHSVILVASSKYFKSCLGSDEGKHFESMPHISSSTMNNLLDFMYTGMLSLNQSNAWLLLAAATQLQVSAVIKLCEDFLKQHSGGKDHYETTGLNICPVGFHGDMEDIKLTVKEDNEDGLFPVGRDTDSGEGNKEQDWPKVAASETCSIDHNYIHPTDGARHLSTSCESRKEAPATVKDVVDSFKPATQVAVQETETTTEYWDDTCWSELEDDRSGSVAACAQMKKTENAVKRKYVMRKMMVMCKFCMKQFRYCSAKKLHVRLNHTYQSDFLRLHFRWKFRKDDIPETNQMLLPGGAIQHGCIACGAKFTLRSLCRAHFKNTHHVKPKCNTCSKMFQSRKLLMIHRACSHKMAPAVGRLLCGQCHRPFIHQRVFVSHQCRRNRLVECKKNKKRRRKSEKYVYDKSKFLLVCPFCSQSFCYRKSFMNHIAKHTGEKTLGKTSNNSHRKGGKSIAKRQENVKKTQDHLSHAVKRRRNRTFMCEEGCALVLPSYADLRQHMKLKHPLVVFQCGLCHYHTSVGRMMAIHSRLKHSNDKDKICDICGKEFSKPSTCKIHKYTRHDVDDPSVKVYYCDVPGCKYRTCQITNLKVHKKNHDSDRPFVCSTCGKKLKTEQTLEKHVQKVHLGIRPFICEKCGQAYGEARELDFHLARHNTEKKYHCDQCDYATHVKANYHSHMFAMHKVTASGQKIYRCSVCDYATDRRGRMRVHETCHLGIRNFCCSLCDKRFMTQPTLNEHVRCMHTPKTLRCNLCSYVSSTQRHLAEHTRVMHTYRQLRPYQCMYCDYRSSISGNCRKHCKSKHRGMPVKWIKVCDKNPEYSASSAVSPGGEDVQPGGDEAGESSRVVQPDIHNTEVTTNVSTKDYHPMTVQSTLAVSQPDFSSIDCHMSHDQPVSGSYDALNTAYNTGQFFS